MPTINISFVAVGPSGVVYAGPWAKASPTTAPSRVTLARTNPLSAPTNTIDGVFTSTNAGLSFSAANTAHPSLFHLGTRVEDDRVHGPRPREGLQRTAPGIVYIGLASGGVIKGQ